MVIVGGVAAKEGQVPWLVLMENTNNGELCGGSILNRKFVLTAAHCIDLFKQEATDIPYPKNILSILKR